MADVAHLGTGETSGAARFGLAGQGGGPGVSAPGGAPAPGGQ